MSLFSGRLRILRENKKKLNSVWTQEYVANKIGVARVTYTAYEKGTKQPPMETITNIAILLETNTDYLHGLTDDSSPMADLNKGLTDEKIVANKRRAEKFSQLPPERQEQILELMRDWIKEDSKS